MGEPLCKQPFARCLPSARAMDSTRSPTRSSLCITDGSAVEVGWLTALENSRHDKMIQKCVRPR